MDAVAVDSDAVHQQEEKIFRLCARGHKDEAKKQLLELVVACARRKDFLEAERLQERLYEIDPLALTEIITSSEIIEQEKAQAVEPDFAVIWKTLRQALTPGEFTTLYHSLIERNYLPGEVLVNQGDQCEALFFINQGRVTALHRQKGREIYIRDLEPGALVGENFFTASFWTVTLVSATPVRAALLERSQQENWQENFPGLAGKLQAWYGKHGAISSHFFRKQACRRCHERYPLSRKITFQLFDPGGRLIKRAFRGDLMDISRGGLSFLVRITNKKKSQILLGRQVQIRISPRSAGDALVLGGTILAVHPFSLLDRDYALHVGFGKPLAQSRLNVLLGRS